MQKSSGLSMDALQVAIDYAEVEGFQYTRLADKTCIEIYHPLGAASVHVDGSVESLPNPRLKEVLEKKLAQARAKESQLLQDPSGRCTIKFSARYCKMPADTSHTTLLNVLKVKRTQLSPQFLEWDTKFADLEGNYPLSSGPEFLVLLLLSEYPCECEQNQPRLWTTIRAAWPLEKEDFYRSHVGELVNIEIKGGNA
jgi:hypothetical protein